MLTLKLSAIDRIEIFGDKYAGMTDGHQKGLRWVRDEDDLFCPINPDFLFSDGVVTSLVMRILAGDRAVLVFPTQVKLESGRKALDALRQESNILAIDAERLAAG